MWIRVCFVRRRVLVLFSAIAGTVACCALVAGGGAASAGAAVVNAPAAAGATGTWGDAATLSRLPSLQPYIATMSVVSCTAPGDCSAAGYYGYDDNPPDGFLVDETGGTWGKLQSIPGSVSNPGSGPSATVQSLSCASPGNCTAGGSLWTYVSYNSPYESQAFVVNETDGSWGTAEIVPGTQALNVGDVAGVTSVSCTAVGDCTAGGSYQTSPFAAHEQSQSQAFVADETNGVWGTAHSVPRPVGVVNAAIYSVSCSSPGNCAAGGQEGGPYPQGQAFVIDETDGTWGSAEEVPGTTALNVGDDATVNSVSCTEAGNCSAGGYYDTLKNTGKAGFSATELQAFVVNETGGVWGAAREVPGTAVLNAGANAQVTSVSCASPSNCAAGGSYAVKSSATRAFIVNETGGIWGQVEEVPGSAPGAAKYGSAVTSVSCPSAGNCSAGGYDYGSTNFASQPTGRAFLVSETRGVWGTARGVPGMAALNRGGPSTVTSLSCASATDCAAGGGYGYASSEYPYVDPFVVDESVHAPTVVAVRVSAATVTYGNEQAEHITVKVTPRSAGTPSGQVIVASGATTLCKITLAAGTGSCAPTAAKFAAGLVKVTASYRGSFAFGASLSAPAAFTVVKAGTTTSLRLSAARVTYGQEQAEKLALAVSPRHGDGVAGRVAVKVGRTTVCVITVKSDSGGCILTAKELPAGTYRLTATYRGSTDYASSASAKETLVVAR